MLWCENVKYFIYVVLPKYNLLNVFQFWPVDASFRVEVRDQEYGPNTKLFSFWKFYVYWIPNYSFFENEWILNSTIQSQLFKYRILKSNRSPPKILYVKFVSKWDEENLILYFHTYKRAFYCVFYTYIFIKKF